MSSASTRPVGWPTSVYAVADFGSDDTAGTSTCEAAAVSDPYVAERPSGAHTAGSWVLSVLAGTFHCCAAAVTRRARAAAASWRTGSHRLRTEVEPPVDCAVPRSCRALDSGTSTSARRASN